MQISYWPLGGKSAPAAQPDADFAFYLLDKNANGRLKMEKRNPQHHITYFFLLHNIKILGQL